MTTSVNADPQVLTVEMLKFESAWVQCFLRMAAAGDLRGVHAMYADKVISDLDATCEEDPVPAVVQAAEHGHLAVVKYLVEQGVSIEGAVDTPDYMTPLQAAAKMGHLNIVQYLLGAGAKPETRGGVHMMAYELAFMNDHRNVVDVLLRAGSPESQLLLAAMNQDLVNVRNLLLAGANPTGTDSVGQTILLRLADHGDFDVIQVMVETLEAEGKQDVLHQMINSAASTCITPLLAAAAENYVSIVKYLVSHGAFLECKLDTGSTPLDVSTRGGHLEVVRVLLAAGSNPNTVDKDGDTPLFSAAGRGYCDIAQILVEYGAELEVKNNSGFAPLHLACQNGHLEMVNTLLDHGADVNSRTGYGLTGLMIAIAFSQFSVAKLLIERHADVQAKSDDFLTPLYLAVRCGNVELCELLLRSGAGIGHASVSFGYTLLHSAARNGLFDVVKNLVENGADVNATALDGTTPLYHAALFLRFDIVDYLSEHGATAFDDSNEVWPLFALRELANEPSNAQNQTRAPRWFIDSSEIKSDQTLCHGVKGISNVSAGTWRGSNVTLIMPSKQNLHFKHYFAVDVMQWYPLNHPHILKFFGACYRNGQLIMVTESIAHGNLRTHLKDHPHQTWKMLLEVALAIQYLHERENTNAVVTGDNILVGEDGKAKLAGLGSFTNFTSESDNVWRTPLELRGDSHSAQDDVYSLGICIIEAVSGQTPYTGEAQDRLGVQKLIKEGVLPKRPASLSDQAWDLVTRMCRVQHNDRINMDQVVQELRAMAEEEAHQYTCKDKTAPRIGAQGHQRSLRQVQEDITQTLSFCLDVALTPERQLVDRLADILHQLPSSTAELHQLQESKRPSSLTKYVVENSKKAEAKTFQTSFLVKRFDDLSSLVRQHLTAIDVDALNITIQRRRERTTHSLHTQIDRLMELLQLDRSTDLHDWEERWNESRRNRLQELEKFLEECEITDSTTATLLLHELTNAAFDIRSIKYSIIEQAMRRLRAIPGVHLPNWFIPPYEVKFDAHDEYRKGGFGSVHRGTWMNNSVLVKKLLKPDRAGAFEREASIWFRLYHPHVIKLFGACHLGIPFFVCEFAENGQLDQFLRYNRDVLWPKLYEATLGLQHLHRVGILHCDLKCNNFLVMRDGTVKVADFGLSSEVLPREPDAESDVSVQDNADEKNDTWSSVYRVGAVRWKAPEVLRGEAATCASDVYSMAMVIVEAVTGTYPWHAHRGDEHVCVNVLNGQLFPRPKGFTDAQWDLIEHMCRFHADERMQLDDVVLQLAEFAQPESESESTGDVVVATPVTASTSAAEDLSTVSTDTSSTLASSQERFDSNSAFFRSEDWS